MRIGNVELCSNLVLAPLAGYCDRGFRVAVRRLGGLGLAVTDLISSRGLVTDSAKTWRLLETCPEDQPLAVQLFGADSRVMADAARQVVDHGAPIVDINMGCPVDKVTQRNGGAALLCDPAGSIRLAETVVRAVPVPVTVKVRLGPDDAHFVAPQLARGFAAAGVAALTVHGRTTAQRFSGSTDLRRIAEVVAAAGDLPVIGNGDVQTPHDALTMLEQTGCAGVMIGRGALHDPWIFRDTAVLLRTGGLPPAPTRAERVALIEQHFDAVAAQQGERLACHMIRQRLSWYARKLGPCKALKTCVSTVHSAAEFHELMAHFVADGQA
jgi:tRNA-dihydrouridine synthase B